MLECDFCGCYSPKPGKGWVTCPAETYAGLAEPGVLIFARRVPPSCSASDPTSRPSTSASSSRNHHQRNRSARPPVSRRRTARPSSATRSAALAGHPHTARAHTARAPARFRPPASRNPSDQPTAAATTNDPKDDLLLQVGQPPRSTRRVTVAAERRSITAPMLRAGVARAIAVHVSQVPGLAGRIGS